jgi:hypothetical protein
MFVLVLSSVETSTLISQEHNLMTDRNRVGPVLVGLLIVMSLVAAGLTPASARQNPVATVTVVDGTLTITRASGDSDQLAGDDVALVGVGDQIAVSDKGEALITFFEGVETRLGPGSVADVKELNVEESTTEITLSLSVGQAINSVQTALDDDSHFLIDTPAATVSVRGTEFVVFARANELIQVVTTDGLVTVDAMGESAEVPLGYGLKLLPGEVPGPLAVWGQSTVALKAPVGDVDRVSVTYINRDNGQPFYYRTGDTMAVALGDYDLVVNTPAPHRLRDIPFGADTQPDEIRPIEIDMSGMVLHLVDEDGELADAGKVYLRLLRGDGLAAESVVTPGEPFIVGPGYWSIEAALEETFAQSQILALDVVEGQTYVVPVTLGGFED